MKTAGRIALGLAVSAGLLVLVLWPLDLTVAWQRARAADVGWLAASLAVSLAVLVARGLRFRVLTTVADWRSVTAAIAAQNFLLRITPLRAGELSLPWFLRRRSGEPAARTLVSLVLVRLADLCVLTLAALVAGLAWFGAGHAGALAMLGLGAALLITLLVRFRPALRLGVRLAAATARALRLAHLGPVQRGFVKLEAALADGEHLSGRRWLLVVVGTVAVAILQFVLFACLLAAFGTAPDVRQLLVGASLAQITGALPLTTVGSFGTHEAGWIAGFVWVGMPVQEAALTAVATQIITLVFAGIFALPGWLYLGGGAAGAAEKTPT